MRMILIVLNFIFMIFGIVVLGVGIWVTVDFSFILQYFPPDLAQDETIIKGAGYACITLGTFVIFVGAFGGFGAWKKKRILLGIVIFIFIKPLICNLFSDDFSFLD